MQELQKHVATQKQIQLHMYQMSDPGGRGGGKWVL